jgi:hypothetical protein
MILGLVLPLPANWFTKPKLSNHSGLSAAPDLAHELGIKTVTVSRQSSAKIRLFAA